jgi:threonyl-tRNA synthetase
LKREHQCGTLQLDFQLPERFKLTYSNDENEGERQSRPVMIHRAIYGSFERFLAILTEHYGGKWPFWLSPRQIIVIPITQENLSYAEKVYNIFNDEGFFVDLDNSTNQIKKKIRNAQLSQHNLIFVVGREEQEKETINLRIREEGDKILGQRSITEMLEYCKGLKKDKK